MSENCPECNSNLIELGHQESHVSSDYQVQTYDVFVHYGYWRKFCEKMYVKKHKSWLEPWKYGDVHET